MRAARTPGLVLLLSLMLGACGSPTASPSGATASGGATDVPGSATTGRTSQLADFEGRLRDATAREGALVRTIAAASAGTRVQMRLAVAQMNRWVDDERAWLSAHPVEPCYAAAATTFVTAIDAISTSAVWF